jgi:hypothetical protein
MTITPIPEDLTAIECLELAESLLENRYGRDMKKLYARPIA